MDHIRLLVASLDLEYASLFGRTIALHVPIFQVEISESGLQDHETIVDIADTGRYDLILVDGSVKEALEARGLNLPSVIGLIENKEKKSIKNDYLYRFAGVTVLASELQRIHAQISGEKWTGCSETFTHLIGVTGAAGGIGKTALAIGVGRALSSLHKGKVLYVSMEEAESTGIYFKEEEGGLNLGDYIYYLFSEREQQIVTYGDAFLMQDHFGLKAFRPGKGMNELGRLSQESLNNFFESLIKNGSTRFLVVDFPLDTKDSTKFLMMNCSRIVLVETGEPTSIQKNLKLLRYYENQHINGLAERLIHVRNKWIDQPEEISPTPDIYIEFDPLSFNVLDDHVNLRNDQSFGIGVMNLAEKIGRTV